LTVESRLANVEEALRLLRDANRLQRRPVSAAAPADNELLGWNATTKKWEPKGSAPAARVYNSGALTISHNTNTALTFDSERFDTDTIHNTGSNTGRLTATTAGKYLITALVRWAANATGRRSVTIREGGDTSIGVVQQDAAAGGGVTTVQEVSCLYDLAANEYVEVVVNQNSGGDLTVDAESNYSPEFMMVRMGPRGSASGAVGDDHGTLTGLGDDDHSLYLLAAGTRAGSTGSAQDFGATGIKADVLAESTADAGVAADGVKLKDKEVHLDNAGATLGVVLKQAATGADQLNIRNQADSALAGLNALFGVYNDYLQVAEMRYPVQAELTISSGAITVTGTHHLIDTQGDAGSDDLNRINGTADGSFIILHPINDARTIVIKHESGSESNNISCVGQADITLASLEDFAIGIYNVLTSKWFIMAGHAQSHGAGQHSETKVLHGIQFVTAAEDATVETMLALPAACIGESGDMGTVTGVRFKVFLGTAGVTGTMTVKLYADSAPNFPSETEIATVDITTGIEGDDTTITSWTPGTDNFLRAKITAIHSGTAAKNVACVFYYEVTLHA